MPNSSRAFFISAGAGGGAVLSVFGRIGAVVALAGDYAASLVTNDSGVAGASVADALDNLAAAIPPPAAVTSVFGRIGAVVALSGDYNSDQINNASGVPGASVSDALDVLAAAIPPPAAVTSVFGRIGAVVAVAGDYTSSQVSNASAVVGATVSDALNNLNGAFAGFVPTSRVLTAGAGLTGGGDLSANRTFDVGANADGSITVNANDIQVGILATDAQHGNRGGGALHANATGAVAGFMSAADKTKLDGITPGAGVTSVFGRTGAVVAASGDYTSSLVTNASNVDGSSTTDALNTLLAALPGQSQNIFRPALPFLGGTLLTVSSTAYALYIDYFAEPVTIRFVELILSVNAAGAQVAEVGLASTPSAPNKAGQNYTILVADGAVDDLTVGAGTVKRNTTAFSAGAGYVVPAGTHVWACFRAAMGATQPNFNAASANFGQAQALSTAGAAALTAGAVLAGVVPGSVAGAVAPFMSITKV